MKILNLTQHTATPDQIAAGVVEPTPEAKKRIIELLTFETLPTPFQVRGRAYEIASVAAWEFVVPPTETTQGVRYTHAMIGDAPYLMYSLEFALRARDITPLYAFSVRESVDQVQPDGSVRKVAVFRHAGFVGCEADEPESVEVMSESDALGHWSYLASLTPDDRASLATTAESVTALFESMRDSDDAYNFERSGDGTVGTWDIEGYTIGKTAEIVAVCYDGIVYEF